MTPTSIISGLVFILVIASFFLYKWQKKRSRIAKLGKVIKSPQKNIQIARLAGVLKKVAEIKKDMPEYAITPKPVIGKYPAMVITAEGFKWRKIPERIGNIIYCEPSLPQHGAKYMVMETVSGVYSPYDPRETPLLSDETPQKAYRAVKWDVVKRVYTYTTGIWDKINTILIGVIVIGAFMVIIVAIDKLS